MGGARAWERGSPFSDLVPSKGQRPPVSPCRKPVKSLCDCGDRHDALEMFPRQDEGCPPALDHSPDLRGLAVLYWSVTEVCSWNSA